MHIIINYILENSFKRLIEKDIENNKPNKTIKESILKNNFDLDNKSTLLDVDNNPVLNSSNKSRLLKLDLLEESISTSNKVDLLEDNFNKNDNINNKSTLLDVDLDSSNKSSYNNLVNRSNKSNFSKPNLSSNSLLDVKELNNSFNSSKDLSGLSGLELDLLESNLDNSFTSNIDSFTDLLGLISNLSDEEILEKLHKINNHDYDAFYFDPYIKRLILEKSDSINNIYTIYPNISEKSTIHDIIDIFSFDSNRSVKKFNSINIINEEFNNIIKTHLFGVKIDDNISFEELEYILDSLEHLYHIESNKIIFIKYLNYFKSIMNNKDLIIEKIKSLNIYFTKKIDNSLIDISEYI